MVDLRALCDPHAPGVTAWWLGNAGFAVNAAGRVVLIDAVIEPASEDDPMTSEIGLPLLAPLPLRARDLSRADVVLITHDDGDHLAPRTVPELISRTRAAFVGTERTARKLRELGLPEERLLVATYGQRLRVGDIAITPTPARHQEDQGHTARGDCCGFIWTAAGVTFWHPNDTDLLQEHLAVRGVDVLLLPIAPHVLGTEGGIRLANAIGAPHVIPCHYGTYDTDLFWCVGDPEAVRAGIRDAGRRYHRLAVGESFVVPRT